MCSRPDPSCSVDAQAYIAGFFKIDRPCVDTHPNAHLAITGPRLHRERPLREHRSFDRLLRLTKDGEERITIGSNRAATTTVDRLSQELVVSSQQRPVFRAKLGQ
jgi:hypothetical protein